MSLHNILVNNQNDLYCKSITVEDGIISDNLEISGTLTLDSTSTTNYVGGSQITGTPNFSSTSHLNFSTGSLVQGAITIGNSAVATLNGGSSFTSNGIININNDINFASSSVISFDNGCTVNLSNTTYTVSPKWTDGTNSFSVTPVNLSLSIFRFGSYVTASIEGFTYTGVNNPGFFYIPWTGISTDYLPAKNYVMACSIENDGTSAPGYIFCNVASQRYEIRTLTGLNASDDFTGSTGLIQGLGSKFLSIGAPSYISFAYLV